MPDDQPTERADLEALNAAREEGYLLGRRATLRAQLGAILADLGYHAPDTAEAARLVLEREETVAALRRVCTVHGDTAWDPGLHLGDVIEKHLEKHLDATLEPEPEDEDEDEPEDEEPRLLTSARTFYIASSRDRLAEVRALAERLVARGIRNAFDWPSHFEHRCSLDTCGVSARDELAGLEIAAAASADLFIGIARLGKGSHVELGAALARPDSGQIILVGADPADSVFYGARGITRVADLAGLYASLGLGAP